jgi:hypothetical protein
VVKNLSNNNGSEFDPNHVAAKTPVIEPEKLDTLGDEIPIEKIVEKITLVEDSPSVEVNGNGDNDKDEKKDDSESESE